MSLYRQVDRFGQGDSCKTEYLPSITSSYSYRLQAYCHSYSALGSGYPDVDLTAGWQSTKVAVERRFLDGIGAYVPISFEAAILPGQLCGSPRSEQAATYLSQECSLFACQITIFLIHLAAETRSVVLDGSEGGSTTNFTSILSVGFTGLLAPRYPNSPLHTREL